MQARDHRHSETAPPAPPRNRDSASAISYTWDDNGNLVSRGTDTFTWDYASRMTGGHGGRRHATCAYDGEDVRVGKTLSGTPTS
jgi:hypothetical protein